MLSTARPIVRAGLASLAMAFAYATANASEIPSIIQALFEKHHIQNIKTGEAVVYEFERKASEPKLLGENFTDKITLTINEIVDKKRTVGVKIFTGERERDERTITELTGNPVLVFFLDRAVAGFSTLAGGNRAYHKNRFRVAMRTEGGLQPVSFKYKGQDVEGYRLAIRPFTGDRKNVEKMKGYENAEFTFLMSDSIPGYFARMTSHYSSPLPGSPSLDEYLAIEGLETDAEAIEKAAGASK